MCSIASDESPPFADELRAFALAEATAPPPREAVLFYGSSSIRLWSSLTDDFAGIPVINRGFGGSTLAECVSQFDRLVRPLKPRAIVLYAGDNDVDQGVPADRVQSHLQRFLELARSRLGLVPIVFLTIKPSPARMWNAHAIHAANSRFRETVAADPAAHLLDIFPLMLDGNGSPRRELFCDDWLHLSVAGYALWTELVRNVLVEIGVIP